MTIITQRLFSEKEAAAYLGMSCSFLRQARCYGDRDGHTAAPPYIKIGKAVRYDLEDLNKWIDSNRCQN